MLFMARSSRSAEIRVRCQPAQKAELARLARSAGLPLSKWILTQLGLLKPPEGKPLKRPHGRPTLIQEAIQAAVNKEQPPAKVIPPSAPNVSATQLCPGCDVRPCSRCRRIALGLPL